MRSTFAKKLHIIAIISILLLAIVGLIILPSEIGMQINSGGQVSNIMPKWIGVFIPVVMSILLYIRGINENEVLDSNQIVCLILQVVAIGCEVFIYIVNL